MNKLLLYGCLSLALSGCHTLPDKNIDTSIEDVKADNELELIDTYKLFEREGYLYFVLTLKNNTYKTIEIDPSIQPFTVYRQYYERLEERYVISSPRPPVTMIVIEPNDSHDFKYMINDFYIMKDGENVYDFVYFFNKNDDEFKRHGDYKKSIRDDTIFSFTWRKEPDSRKGRLSNYESTDNSNLIANQAQDSLFFIVDYFSSSYFYSEKQIKEFFNADFIVERTESSAFQKIFLFPSSNDSGKNIEKMEIRSNRSGKQLLTLKFKTPLCFDIDSFLYRMKHDDYTWVSDNNQFSFSKIMDEAKNIGTVELFFNSLGDGENQQICVNNLLFDTFEVFDKVKYEQAFREQNSDLH